MLSLALFLLPALPGGSAPDDASRIRYIAEHPWLFRAGWVPWHLSAIADVWLAWVLFRTRWIPRAAAALTLAVTILAVIPDQGAQMLWDTKGVALARTDPGGYLVLEHQLFFYGSGVAPCLYTLAAIGWTWCFAAAGVWTRTLTWLSVVTWTVFAIAGVAPMLPTSMRPSSAFVAAGNAVAFVLLEIWLACVIELVLRLARPETSHGRDARWRHPDAGPIGRAIDAVANSRFLRETCRLLPSIGFRSDITDVVYVSYLVDAKLLEPLVPPGLELQRLGRDRRWALFTFLTYRHGHFGPTFLGPLRKLFPSPIHSNWRIHVVDPASEKRGIYFVTNAITTLVHALGARAMTDGMPMHVFASASLDRDPSGRLRVSLDPGDGTAPDAEMDLRPAAVPKLAAPWRDCFDDFDDFLAYCVPQDRAMATQPWRGTVSRHEIDLGIPLDACEPLEGSVTSRAASAIVGDAAPVCFRVASVAFRFDREEHDAIATTPPANVLVSAP